MPTKILAFEADPSFANELRNELGRYGAIVSIVDDANTGVQLALTERPDLILLSAELPKGANGFSVCNRLKRERALQNVPIIVMSTEANEATFDFHRKLRTPADDYVKKPIPIHILLAHVQRLVPLVKMAIPPATPSGPTIQTAPATEEISAEDLQEEDDEEEFVGTQIMQRIDPTHIQSKIKTLQGQNISAQLRNTLIQQEKSNFPNTIVGIAPQAGTSPPPIASSPSSARSPISSTLIGVPPPADISARISQKDPIVTTESNQELEKKIEELESQRNTIKNLSAEVESLKLTLESANSEIEALKHARETQSQVIEAEQRRIKEISQERDRLSKEVAKLKEKLATLLPTSEQTKEIESLKTVVEKLQKELEEAQNKPPTKPIAAREILEFRESINKKDREILLLREKEASIERELLETREASLAIEKSKIDLEERVEALELAITQDREQVERLSVELASERHSHETTKQTLQLEKETLLQELQRKAKHDLEELRKELDKEKQRAIEDTKEIAIKEREQALEAQRKEEEKAKEIALDNQKSRLETIFEGKLQKLKEEHQLEIGRLIEANANALIALETKMNSKIAEGEERERTLQQDIERRLAERDIEHDKELATYKGKIFDLEIELTTIKQSHNEEKRNFEKNKAQLEIKLASLEDEKRSIEHKVEKLNQTIADLEETLQATRQELASVEHTLANINKIRQNDQQSWITIKEALTTAMKQLESMEIISTEPKQS